MEVRTVEIHVDSSCPASVKAAELVTTIVTDRLNDPIGSIVSELVDAIHEALHWANEQGMKATHMRDGHGVAPLPQKRLRRLN